MCTIDAHLDVIDVRCVYHRCSPHIDDHLRMNFNRGSATCVHLLGCFVSFNRYVATCCCLVCHALSCNISSCKDTFSYSVSSCNAESCFYTFSCNACFCNALSCHTLQTLGVMELLGQRVLAQRFLMQRVRCMSVVRGQDPRTTLSRSLHERCARNLSSHNSFACNAFVCHVLHRFCDMVLLGLSCAV